MKILFALTYDDEKHDFVFTGNCDIQTAFNLLQKAVIAEAITKSKETDNKAVE